MCENLYIHKKYVQIGWELLPFGWNILEIKRTVGGLFGYSSVKTSVSLNVPSSNGVSWGLRRENENNVKNRIRISTNYAIYIYVIEWERYIIYPKITAFQSIILLSVGAPLTPTGGSSWSRLKSRIRRRLAGVDIFFSLSLLQYLLFILFV